MLKNNITPAFLSVIKPRALGKDPYNDTHDAVDSPRPSDERRGGVGSRMVLVSTGVEPTIPAVEYYELARAKVSPC